MRQYLRIKEDHPDGILFFRMGDFYEMFFEDAVIAAKALDLTLTSRDKGKDDAIPMCGVPHHAGRSYIARLTEKGHRVVLVEQMEDPRQAKGLVKRDVVRVITPGIVLDEEVLDPKTSRYVAAVVRDATKPTARARRWGLAYADVSTGEFRATEIDSIEGIAGELSRAAPHEILACLEAPEIAALCERYRAAVLGPLPPQSSEEGAALLEAELGEPLSALGLADRPLAAAAAAAVLRYARDTQPGGGLPFVRLVPYSLDEAVLLDPAAVSNLELVSTLMADEHGRRSGGTLLSIIDETSTAPGGRMLRRWLLYPLTDVTPIRRRQDGVEHLARSEPLRARVRKALESVYDLERLAGRVSLRVATPRDLTQLRRSLRALPALSAALSSEVTSLLDLPELLQLQPKALAELATLEGELRRALADDPPPVLSGGGVIRDGFCPEIDESRALASGGKEALAAIEVRERERTQIPSLRVKYNKVFGYYIEITKTHLDRVPDDYVRKQTIATAERYVTGELAELEARILEAQEKLAAREAELFHRLVDQVAERLAPLIRIAERVATIDCLAALAEVARRRDYVRPEVDAEMVIDIEGGRHPVVEAAVGDGGFVPNDCRLDPDGEQIRLITGPNMAGKSTYMRQVAHIVLLAQMGSFVPARRARVGICDRLFTRVGAADNLARGDSTFMVEMREAAAILAGASRRSLVVLDEVGRGTSTYDGVSIAWAVTEYLHEAVGCRTLFATHYHELCQLAGSLPRLANYSVAVKEQQGEVVFLRQLQEGGANRSYGIEVARLAGLPSSVVSRARDILARLEAGHRLGPEAQLELDLSAKAHRNGGPLVGELFVAAPPAPVADHPVVAELRALSIDTLSPLEALNKLADLAARFAGDRS
jgi:DNA mismatch repair protein MutS